MTAIRKLGIVLAIALSTVACDDHHGGGGGGAGGGGGGGGMTSGDDLSVAADDMSIPPDLAAPQMPMDLSIPTDLQPVCNTDANETDCNGVCIGMGACCTAADCPTPANGTATCDPTSHTCGVSCSPGYRGCGAVCIPSEPDDGGVSMTPDGGVSYNNACCVDSDCPATGEVCPSPGAPCACPTGQTLCTASNSCIPSGQCCTAADCPTPTNGTATCTSGTCGFTCNAGYNQCGSSCAPSTNQCCMTSDCPVNHDSPTCIGGTCGGTCDPGWSDCDGDKKSNGCETNTGGSDVNNCGSCGHVCSSNNGTPSCSSGTCQIACNAGWGDCDGNPANGCETNLNDPSNCGTCGHVCMLANGVAGCTSGTCVLAACNAGWGDCDGNPANGCETNLDDPNNCGTCGKVCSIANGTAACGSGTCTVGSCNAGWADCNNDPSDGCETNLNDPNNCGTCGRQCFENNGIAGCSNGSCTVAACNTGWGDCDGNPANGCETNTTNDDANCGACGNNCAVDCQGNVTGTACSASTCTIVTCAAGYTNLDGTCSDGCECHMNPPSPACAAPGSLGTLSVGQTITVSNNLVPTGTEGYYSVTMTGNANFSYHPHISLSTNPNSEFLFDVRVNCSGGAISCGVEGGASNGLTAWETYYTGGDPNQPSEFNPIPAVGNNGTILIHVYRKGGAATTCNSFTLTISN